jgi:hypothetical protein
MALPYGQRGPAWFALAVTGGRRQVEADIPIGADSDSFFALWLRLRGSELPQSTEHSHGV